ncbi:MAG: hypothetical protein KAI47_27390 [Deltaproteobacteria bacterium]|nr:hypothetical protein [Deltaproteobacteria bacterium]
MLAPLAILTPGISKADLPALRDRVMASDEPHNNKLDVLAFTRVLGSSRFSANLLQSVIRSEIMEHFPEYQRILGKGEARGIQKGKREGKREGISHAIHAIVQGRLGVVPDELDARLAPLTLKKLDALLLRLAASQDEEALRTALADLT